MNFSNIRISLAKKKILFLILGLGILIIFISLGSIYSYNKACDWLVPGKSEFGKVPIIDPQKVSKGYTLFSSFEFPGLSNEERKVYLIDLYGRPVHTWVTKDKPFYSILKQNGNILVGLYKEFDKNYPTVARIYLQELDENSRVVWEYDQGGIHHDFDILPNGNIAILVWEKVPSEIAKTIQGGKRNTEFKNNTIFSDAILEIDQNKKLVWRWNAYENLDVFEFKLPNIFRREQWTHANSIKYVEKDPFFQKEAYLVSLRNIDTLFLISKETGAIIWKSQKGLLGHQHDATLLENGNILVFNNGFYTSDNIVSPYGYGSAVLEINPKTNKVVWEFSGGNTALDLARLSAPILSGAQRLKNGNTLITLGTTGHMLEVTPEKKVVWDLVNPYSITTNQPFPSNYIFKARRYYPKDIKWLESFGSLLSGLPLICQ